MQQEEQTDFLWGVQEIGRYIGRNARQVYHLLQTHKLPAQKIGAIWVARRSQLDARLSGDEGGAR
jgi:hypothetical protein